MNINFFKKSNRTILSILLLCITYSFSYAVTYNFAYDDECKTVTEYIAEKTQLIEHEDLCDTQKQFHNCYTLNTNQTIDDCELVFNHKNDYKNLYSFELSITLNKPPTY